MKTFRKVALIALVVIMASCGKDNKLIGTWVSAGDGSNLNTNVGFVIHETFKTDGTYEEKFEAQVKVGKENGNLLMRSIGKWEMNGEDKIIIKIDSIVNDHDYKLPIPSPEERLIITLDEETFEYMSGGSKKTRTRKK